MAKKTSGEAYAVLSDSINNMLFDSTGFLEAFKTDHRTLQSKVVKLALEVIKTAAELPEDRIDGRNEQAVKKCRTLVNSEPYFEYF